MATRQKKHSQVQISIYQHEKADFCRLVNRINAISPYSVSITKLARALFIDATKSSDEILLKKLEVLN
jgi:hypothetical protein